MQYLTRSVLVVVTLVALGLGGCGETGSDPVQHPEARFDVRPTGQATFRVNSLIGGGVSHASVIGQDFTATAAFDFVLENAAPPFQGIFALVGTCTNSQESCTADADCAPASTCDFGDQQITVTLTVISPTSQTQVSDATLLPGKTTAMVTTGGVVTGTPGPSNPEVRFDMCAPSSGAASCSTTSVPPGDFGVSFSGTLGDPITSHVVNGLTPSIYFLEAPQENVNLVLDRVPFTGAELVVQLFINGQLRQSQSNNGDVVIREDL